MQNFTKFCFVFLLLFFAIAGNAQNVFFVDKPEHVFKKEQIKPIVKPEKYRTVFLDTIALLKFLQTIPTEQNVVGRENTPVIEIPMPKGGTAKFHIWESQIMAPELAEKFPEIKTYTGQGIDDKTATIKIDWTPLGFHAMILSSVTGTIFIDPYSGGNKTNYISYFKTDFKKKGPFQELIPKKPAGAARPVEPGVNILMAVGTQLRTYELAIACTHQYADSVCFPSAPTVPLTLAAIVTTVNRMNEVYENELCIHFNLVASETSIIYVTDGTDPFTGNNNPATLLNESQQVISSVIGTTNYDIGHTFSTGAGGYASVGVVCVNSQKAEGCTGTENPVGDPFVIDYVCHEIGHQFNADHIFNSNLDLCGADGQWNSTTNAEPGSGSTIMGYAATPTLCSSDNLQSNTDPQFHTLSFNQIAAYSITGTGNACATKTNTNNSIPVVNAGADYIIPKSTPFILSGSATDANATDHLTYSWEQIDVGGPSSTWNNPMGIHAPLFRSFPPVDSGRRYFPKIADVVNNTTTIGEILPAIARPMNFRLTARDNRAGGGAVNSDDILVTVSSNGPFLVTYPTATGITWVGNQSKTITWDVANTNIAPISTSNVSIQLSIDGGYTYSITLLAGTPNDGSEPITVPNLSTTTARIRIIADGNIFYDISNNNFKITASAVVTWVDFSAQKNTDSTAKLSWTVNETNTVSYEVQRSDDGINFTSIGSVTANNIPNISQQYNFVDANPLEGINYYRIRQINSNGELLSPQKSVTFNAVEAGWSIYPNPVIDKLSLKSNVNNGKTRFQLFDATGKLVYQKELSTVTAGVIENINMNKYSKGIYILKISSESSVKVTKIVN